MTSEKLLEWCYRNQNPGQPGTATIEFEKLNINPEITKTQVADLNNEEFFKKPLYTSTFCFVEFTDKGLDYCHAHFD